MPIYEYRCRDCDADFERYVPSAATTVACPACAGGRVTRKLSVFAMRAEGGSSMSPVPMPSGGGCCGGGCGCH